MASDKKNIKHAKQDIGLFLLGSLGAFGIWSALNSSIFTIRQFVKDPKSAQNARVAKDVGLVAGSLAAGAMALVFGKRGMAGAAGTAITTVGLWVYWTSEIDRASGQLAERSIPTYEMELTRYAKKDE